VAIGLELMPEVERGSRAAERNFAVQLQIG